MKHLVVIMLKLSRDSLNIVYALMINKCILLFFLTQIHYLKHGCSFIKYFFMIAYMFQESHYEYRKMKINNISVFYKHVTFLKR